MPPHDSPRQQLRRGLSPNALVARLLVGVVLALSLVACAHGATSSANGRPTATTTLRLFADYGVRAAPVLGLVVDKRLRVVDVDPGGVGEQAGVQRGDVLLVIDGVTIASSAGAKQLVNQAFAKQQSVQVVVVRAGQQLTLTGAPANRTTRPGQPTPTAVPAGLGYDYL